MLRGSLLAAQETSDPSARGVRPGLLMEERDDEVGTGDLGAPRTDDGGLTASQTVYGRSSLTYRL